MSSHNILLLGSGGRESALAWKLSQSPHCNNLFISPGNAGTAQYGTNLDFAVTDFEAVKRCCVDHDITLLLPGGEDALVGGIWDWCKMDPQLKHIIIAGPSESGAQLEGSKAFAKRFMQRHNIPTAAYREFDAHNFDEGVAYLKSCSLPIVLKADGLAAGKGVVICDAAADAVQHLTDMIQGGQFGIASSKVVVEEFLSGIELSVFALTDGQHYVLLPEAKDYKRVGEGDTGPNTGGMGAISPVPFADDAFMQKVKNRIIHPTVSGLQKEGINYQGFIFFGLINVAGNPYVIEYNCRMGDPETEVVMPRLKSDLVSLIEAMQDQRLHEVAVAYESNAAATVMVVSAGYPGSYAKGKIVSGITDVSGSIVFHAGTQFTANEIQSNGGRVLAVTSYGATLTEALAQSYENIKKLSFDGMTYRKDIGWEF